MPQTHFRTCHLCEAMCGLEIDMEGDQVTQIRGDKNDPLSRGHICPKAVAIGDLQNDPDRLRAPMRRNGDQWEAIDWDTALDEVAGRIAAIKTEHGGNAVGIYAGNPNVHNYGNMTHSNLFLKQIKTRNRFSATSVDQMPHQLLGYWMFGHQLLVPIPDIDHTQYFLMLGANPLASNGSLMTVPDVRRRLLDLKERGGKLVQIDPRRNETAQLADEFHFIQPGTDAALLAAMAGNIFSEGLAKPGRLADMLTGLDAVAEALKPFTPERAAAVTGIPADTIRRLARDFAAAEAAACYGRMGVSTQEFGTLCQWLIQIINIATGNLDRKGGVLFTKPALDTLAGPMSRPGHFDAWRSRVRQLPEFSGELPASAMAEEILTPGEGQIRAMVTVAGNPVLSTPNGSRLEKAFGQLEFMVSIDCYINETTRLADIILPPSGPLERDHYDIVFNVLAVRNTARYSSPILPKQENSKHDWEIMRDLGNRLAKALGNSPPVPLPPPHMLLDMGLNHGPYGPVVGHPLALTLNSLRENPSGIDLGPLEPSLPNRLFTADKKILCNPEALTGDLKRLDTRLDKPAEGLVLIGRRHLRSNNSWMHNSERLIKGPARNQLFMHPDDLTELGLEDGATVRVTSRTGSVTTPVKATTNIKPGVVSLPHGWGHGRKGARLNVAATNPGVSINDLTDHLLMDELSGNAAVNGVPVTVSQDQPAA
ncbi:MAG: molybdopterin oxidoreductase family protein [Acidobacteriota bacterium]|nr:molybdopterin oxidoreductase family protein [Acidobacteriota bacterium]